ncbi:MAG TPA: arginine--tRNA ligase [Gammaproteobacteria bacterium]|nr:arginine--tRNA ligase [Gammaproteobacteria bacterium]
MTAGLRQRLADNLAQALAASALLPADTPPPPIRLDRTRERSHGDYASNLALALAPLAQRKPREIAEALRAALPAEPLVERVEIAGPGFLNFFLSPAAYHAIVREAARPDSDFGRLALGGGERVLLEFVSANPTGPLHVGHGRGAAYGASLGNILEAAGFAVSREYYVNDAGRQMDILAASVYLRYLQACTQNVRFPDNGYRGAYVAEIADALKAQHGERFFRPVERLTAQLPPDAGEGGDKEAHIDALIARIREQLGTQDYALVFDAGLQAILADIREDLAAFGVTFDEWFPERRLHQDQAIEQVLAILRERDQLYTEAGATWFRASDWGDEKDRVVVRENGAYTYFAADIAYHLHKRRRGFDRLIDLWGADHHGYVPRVRAAMAALGEPVEALEVLLVQFAILYRGRDKISMSTRAGQFVTLRELREEVGTDAARFFYVMRAHEQHLDFDLELAKSQSNENPVYYVQYAHARVCSVFAQLADKGFDHDAEAGAAQLAQLETPHEQALMVELARYPEVLELAATQRAPHHLAHYLRELAGAFHTYYNAHTFLVEDATLRDARLCLIGAVRRTIADGLGLLGVSAPEAM